MNLIVELIKFIALALGIVLVSKYLLVTLLRKISKLLNLSAKASGNIAGISTSVPELLTVIFSVTSGLMDTSVYNIISSNVINLVQYTFSIYLNKNQKYLNNKAIIIDLVMVVITIFIPVFIVGVQIDTNLMTSFIFVVFLILFYYINHNVHKLYLEREDEELLKEENSEKEYKKYRIARIIIYILGLVAISIVLYFLGELLSVTLKNLALEFKLPEMLLGILLGLITSLPELITFIESQRKEKIKNSELANKLGVVEATNNLLTSNLMNLFVIQSIGILIYELINR